MLPVDFSIQVGESLFGVWVPGPGGDRLTLIVFAWSPHRAVQLQPCFHKDRPVIGEQLWYTAILFRVCNPFTLIHTYLLIKCNAYTPSFTLTVFARIKHKQWSTNKIKTQKSQASLHWTSVFTVFTQEAGLYIGEVLSHFASLSFCSLYFAESRCYYHKGDN